MSKKYNIQFLEDKLGKFDTEYKYPRISLIEGPLFYIEKQTKKELKDEIKSIKADESFNPTYIWGYVIENDAIYVTRTFGENKVFIYNPKSMKKTEYVKGKLKVLKKFNQDTIDALFDQKAVFDHFYKKLWDIRLKLGIEIRNKNDIPDNIALMEAQHIIDRIIFSYFICEKKLISVKDYGPISGKELFSDIIGQLPDTWDYLKKLFFEQFARPGADDLDCGGDVCIKTPYLNGGLFRPKIISNISEEKLFIQYDWNDIFEPLNKYSWLIEDEITDLEGEYEGNLTPEIIGHIYEKFVITMETLDEIKLEELNFTRKGDLKRGNKKIGAYYTPEHITGYMASSTIIPHIYRKLGVKKENDFEELLNADSETLKEALRILDEITICDPACGSGAFLIKAGELILELKLRILKKLSTEEFDRYNIKRDIIIKNLFGVDLQEGAVEICKLRLWLWLISSAHSDDVEPLPNIEYNFRVGNSLVGWLDEELNQISLNNPLTENVKGIFKGLIALVDYEDENTLISAEELLKGFKLENYIDSYYQIYTLYRKTHGRKAEKLKDIMEEIRSSIYNSINPAFRDYTNKIINKKYNKNKPPIDEKDFRSFNPFHWRIDFGHIIKKGGFDIVIGNPPYFNVETLGANSKFVTYIKNMYNEIWMDKSDILFYFIFRSIYLTQGYTCLIVSNAFLFADKGKKLRNFIVESSSLSFIANFEKHLIFEGVSITTAIIKFNTFKTDGFTQAVSLKDSKYSKNSLHQILNTPENFVNLEFEKNSPFALITSEIRELNDKIDNKHPKLGELVVVGSGMQTAANNVFVFKEYPLKIDKKFIKKRMSGEIISRYFIGKEIEYLLYFEDINDFEDLPNEIQDYLLENKQVLENRADKKRRKTSKWWNYSFPMHKEYYDLSKIWCSYRSKENCFVLDETGDYIGLTNTTVIFDTNEDISLKYILALLNSKLLTFRYKFIGKQTGNGLYEYFENQISSLPIPKIDIQLQNSFINKSEMIIGYYNLLKKEKYDFTKWLYNCLKIKDSDEFENYDTFSKDNFLKHIRKHNSDLMLKEDLLLKKFEESISKIENLEEKIKNLDKNIDEMVFNLYGLNDNEINLVHDYLE